MECQCKKSKGVVFGLPIPNLQVILNNIVRLIYSQYFKSFDYVTGLLLILHQLHPLDPIGHLLCNMIYYLHNKFNRINENLYQQTDLNTIWKYNFFNLIFKII